MSAVPKGMELAAEDLQRASERVMMALRAYSSALADSEGDHALVADTCSALEEAAQDAHDATNALLRWAQFRGRQHG